MTIQDALRQIETSGGFQRAAAGDQEAANYVVRYAAYLANPSGDPASWGWLTKSSGESGVDADGGGRFAEDALCLGADPNNTNNVYDFVGGTGAPGARLLYGATPVQRRSSNQWYAPRPLSAREMAYIGLGAGSGEPVPTPTPTPTPPPQPTPCQFQPVDLTRLTENVHAVFDRAGDIRDAVDNQVEDIAQLTDKVQQVLNLLSNIDARLQQGLVIDASVPVLGRIRGTIKG